MVVVERWKTAQQYEAGYWARQAEAIANGTASQLEWYRWRADQLRAWMAAATPDHADIPKLDVVEVGSGPVGLASFLDAKSAVLVDPLNDHYAALASLTTMRNPSATYLTGRGESLPVAASAADLLVIENCIDHVQDIDGVMKEIVRVLRPHGLLYLTVNCRSPIGYLVHRAISTLSLDPGHPHTFTPARLRTLLVSFGFDLIEMRVGSYWTALRDDLASKSRRDNLKGVLGVSEYLSSVLARRR